MEVGGEGEVGGRGEVRVKRQGGTSQKNTPYQDNFIDILRTINKNSNIWSFDDEIFPKELFFPCQSHKRVETVSNFLRKHSSQIQYF